MAKDERLDPRITHIELKEDGLEIIFKGKPTTKGGYDFMSMLLPGIVKNYSKR